MPVHTPALVVDGGDAAAVAAHHQVHAGLVDGPALQIEGAELLAPVPIHISVRVFNTPEPLTVAVPTPFSARWKMELFTWLNVPPLSWNIPVPPAVWPTRTVPAVVNTPPRMSTEEVKPPPPLAR